MTREEAIKIIKERISKQSWCTSDEDMEALYKAIPELTESEDERIRKFLIDILSSGVWRTEWPFSPVDCVAYLEKQKEQQPAEWSEDERMVKAIEYILYENYSDAAVVEGVEIAEIVTWLEKQKENPKSADSIPSDCVSDAKCEDRSPKHSDSDWTDIRDTPAYWKGWDDAMKQKEQKHPNGCFTCDEYKKGYEEGRRNGFTAGYNKAMKEVEQKEQKPWSEEDEEMIGNIISSLRGYMCLASKSPYYTNHETHIQKEIEFLNSLRPQSKRGWSDGDKKNLERVIDCIYEFYPDPVMKYKLKDWLQSLTERFNLQVKNEWSEEDKEALERAIDCVRTWEIDYCGGDNKISERLKSLRLQLKQ